MTSCLLHGAAAWLLYAHGGGDRSVARTAGGSEPMRLEGVPEIGLVRETPAPMQATALVRHPVPAPEPPALGAEEVTLAPADELDQLLVLDPPAAADGEPDVAPPADTMASPFDRFVTALCAKVPARASVVAPLGTVLASAQASQPERDGVGDALHGEGGSGGGESQVKMAAAPSLDAPHCRAPLYPAKARRLGLQGVVLIELDVGADGAILTVSVVQSSGHELLDDEAVRTLRSWQCSPARAESGAPIAGKLRVPVRFQLTPLP
ncbi:MAG: energy transducer TonB [Planctomycetota bacterium]